MWYPVAQPGRNASLARKEVVVMDVEPVRTLASIVQQCDVEAVVNLVKKIEQPHDAYSEEIQALVECWVDIWHGLSIADVDLMGLHDHSHELSI